MAMSDLQRRRALIADGYFLFLDPLKPAHIQSKVIAEFAEDARLVRGLRVNQQLQIPVAICISKIDLLATRPEDEDSGDTVHRFYNELKAIDPTGMAIRRDLIDARSRLTADLSRSVWRNWELERLMRELFGDRFKFFPLTPVGLNGTNNSPSPKSFVDPFGILEPLLWLLQMNGYHVIK